MGKRIRHTPHLKGSDCRTIKESKFLCFNEDHCVVLFEDNYKTRRTCCPNRTDLTKVAKVLRLSNDRETAYLGVFQGRPGKFKLTAGKSYRESVNALILPIDIVYSNSNGMYELRTSKLEIHQQVRKR